MYHQVRKLGFSLIFAPCDFMGCLASNYSKENLEKVAMSIENNIGNDSFSRKLNLDEIKKWRKLTDNN